MSSHLPQFPHDPSAVGHVSDAAYDAGHTDGRLVGKAERDALQAKLDRVEKLVEQWRRFGARSVGGSGRSVLAAAVRDLDRALTGEAGA